MNQQAVNPSASDNNAENQASLSSSFKGFEPIYSNYVFCPNQFFDICLKSNSRGMVRIVAYMIRQTLGWLDENGEPVQQTVKVSYNNLIRKAGVSRGAIAEALQRAVAMGFLDCHTSARPDQRGLVGQSAEYTLKWSTSDQYANSLEDFDGFYSGEGHRSPVPNAFFDQIIPKETLAVTKVVGAVIRHTVGYQNQFGGRRSVTPLSCSYIQRYTAVSKREAIVGAIRHAQQAGFIARVKDGNFSPIANEQAPATYAIRWQGQADPIDTSSKWEPATDQFKKGTSTGSKREPGDRFKKGTSIEKTNSNNTFKQQAVVDLNGIFESLIKAGFDRHSAGNLLRKSGVEVVKRQLDWIDARNPKNKTAMLRRAIEHDWKAPEKILHKEKIAKKRDQLSLATKKLQEADRVATESKRVRLERKKELLAVWAAASMDTRKAWIENASNRVTGERLSNIIRRQSPETENPHSQVLEELERNVFGASNGVEQTDSQRVSSINAKIISRP